MTIIEHPWRGLYGALKNLGFFRIEFSFDYDRFELFAPEDWDWLNDQSGAGAIVDELESEHDVLYMGRSE